MSDIAATMQDPPDDDDGAPSAAFWLSEIASSKIKYGDWHKRGDAIIRRYKDERSVGTQTNNLTDAKKLNLLWSNVETVKPALYSQTPKANVTRRNKDEDALGRTAATIIERCVAASLGTQVGMSTFDDVMGDVRDDLLLPGQGVAIEEYGADIKDGQTVTNQRSTTRYIHWKDWLTNICRTWSEVWWWGYRSYLTREQAEAKWGEEKAAKLAYTHKPDETNKASEANAEQNNQAVIWTIWSLRHRQVFMVAEGYGDELLNSTPPPVEFEGFWPIPRPVQATVAKDVIIPVPDFVFYQDQADTIDKLTNRIDKLSDAIRMRGLYPADMDSLKRLIQDGSDLDMIPVENWAMLAERGGAAALVAWFPIQEVAKALVEAINARQQQIENVYQLTGLSDILRGATDPNETAAAQQIKGQWGSLRIRPRQRALQRFARDIIRLKAEIIAEHFNQHTLAEMSGVKLLTNQEKTAIQGQMQLAAQQFGQAMMQAQVAQQQGVQVQPPQPPQPPPGAELLAQPSWEDVIGLLRNSKLRGFVIDVETDSTVEPDQMQEQQKAVEFIGATVQFLEVAAKVLPIAPQAAPMLGELLMFGVRRFKIAESVETAIENFTKQVAASANQPKPPDPQMMKAQADVKTAEIGQQTAQIKGAAEQQKAQVDLIGTIVEHQTTMREKQMDAAVAAAAPQPQPNGGMP